MSEWKETTFGIIPGDWDVKGFKDVLKIKGRIGWKGYKTSDLRESGPVVIGGVNIKSTINLDYSKLTHLSIEKYEESPEIILRKGDVILVTRGNGIGDVGRYDGKFQEATINPSVVILTDYKGDSKFLYYFLASKQGREQILSLEGGSSIPALYQGLLKNLNLPFPKIEIQKTIATFLSSIDDKIDLLHHQNATLEAMAETLFRHWFVEDAKEDWEDCMLDDLCVQIASGGTPSTKMESYYNGNINWYSTKELQDNFLYESKSKITKEGLENSSAKLFQNGTVIIAIYAAPTVGRLGILAEKASFNQAACGLVANEELCCTEFIYLYLKNQRNELNAMASGSAQQNLNVSKIKTYPAFIVPKELMKNFKEIIQPVFRKINRNTSQIRTLTALRDTLLPKLMSGEVRVEM